MNADRILATFFTSFLAGIICTLTLERAVAPSRDSAAEIQKIQKQVDLQGNEIGLIERNSRLGNTEGSKDVEAEIKSIQNDSIPSFEERSFWATTALTILAVMATLIGLSIAMVQLFNFRKIARAAAREEFDELNTLVTGRLNNAVSIVFGKISWKDDYLAEDNKRSADIYLGERACFNAETALSHFRNVKRNEYKYFKGFALNNVLFYTVLAKSKNATESEARKMLALAGELKQEKNFEDDSDFITTYALVLITFNKYLGDGTKASILKRLAPVEALLKKALETYDDQPVVQGNITTLITKLEATKKEVNARTEQTAPQS